MEFGGGFRTLTYVGLMPKPILKITMNSEGISFEQKIEKPPLEEN